MITVGKRLRNLRESVKLSQTKIGDMAGVKQSAMNRYEHNQAEAPYKVLLWYADYFDVSMDYIFGRTDKPQGKLYDFRPKMFDKEMEQFVEMCFDPKSPMNGQLKQAVMRLMEDGKK